MTLLRPAGQACHQPGPGPEHPSKGGGQAQGWRPVSVKGPDRQALPSGRQVQTRPGGWGPDRQGWRHKGVWRDACAAGREPGPKMEPGGSRRAHGRTVW